MARFVFLFAALLVGCAPDAKKMALADIDLGNMQSVQAIRSQLGPHDGAAFASYVIRHHRLSVNFCGQPPINSDGKEPTTVGEAIDLAMLREAAERQASRDAKRPKHRRELAREQWTYLISQRDTAIDAQSRLRMQFGDEAELRPEWKSSEIRMNAINQKLRTIKSAAFGVR